MSRILYIDVTTSWEDAGRHAHGTTRVERGIVEALAALAHPDIRFFRFERQSGRFKLMTRDEALAAATARPLPDTRRLARSAKRSRLSELGRAAEHWVRNRIRAPFRRWRAMRASKPLIAPEPAKPEARLFEPRSVLLFPGEMHRHDFAALMVQRRKLSLDFAFVFYDLHAVLPLGDPRLADPTASDVPGTDFFVREGFLLFSISRFSTGKLRTVLDERRMEGPPVKQIRLAGKLPQSAATLKPVAGLEPGRFVLTVGDLVERKNQAMLIDVWERLADEGAGWVLPLVCVGRLTREFAGVVEKVRSHPLLNGLIHFEPNLDDEKLGWLYGNCRFTVFASLSEGFGLPVAESLAYGKVCVASTAEAIPEAGQGVAIGIDPRDRDEWTRTVGLLMRDDAILTTEQANVAARFRPVRWTDTAADILDGFAELREPNPRPFRTTSCLIPGFDGSSLSSESKDAL